MIAFKPYVAIIFEYKGFEIHFLLNPLRWLRGQVFHCVDLCMTSFSWFKIKKEIDKYTNMSRGG